MRSPPQLACGGKPTGAKLESACLRGLALAAALVEEQPEEDADPREDQRDQKLQEDLPLQAVAYESPERQNQRKQEGQELVAARCGVAEAESRQEEEDVADDVHCPRSSLKADGSIVYERGSQGSNLESPVLETGALPIRPLPPVRHRSVGTSDRDTNMRSCRPRPRFSTPTSTRSTPRSSSEMTPAFAAAPSSSVGAWFSRQATRRRRMAFGRPWEEDWPCGCVRRRSWSRRGCRRTPRRARPSMRSSGIRPHWWRASRSTRRSWTFAAWSGSRARPGRLPCG